jgi:hypothetical protein
MKSPLKLLSPLLLFSLFGCVADDQEATVIQGTWQSTEFTDSQSNKPSDIIYEFNGNNFKELISIKNDDDTYEIEENAGNFTILEQTFISEDGEEVYQVNFIYDRDDNSSKFDIAYIQDGELFFGSANATDCSDETYEVVTSETSTEGQIISTEKTTCYARPTKLNFNLPFYDID